MIRSVFDDFHACFAGLDARYFSGDGEVIELGAGVYPVRETIPGVVATDVVPASHLDRTLDAGQMDIHDSTVRSFYLQNVFHHFPRPSRFFSELERTLVPGGGAILIEPSAGPLAKWLYPRLFSSEGYELDAASWDADIDGPMSGANQALSYVVFDRDFAQFSAAHPRLEVVHRDVLPQWPRYLVSGGLNFRPLLPGWLTPAVRAMERLLYPLRGVFGLHRVIVIRKRATPA